MDKLKEFPTVLLQFRTGEWAFAELLKGDITGPHITLRRILTFEADIFADTEGKFLFSSWIPGQDFESWLFDEIPVRHNMLHFITDKAEKNLMIEYYKQLTKDQLDRLYKDKDKNLGENIVSFRTK